MPTKKTIEYTIYKFDELDEKAKEKAREWWRDGERQSGDNYWSESVIEDATQCAVRMGIDIDKIYWSGFGSQGDGACFVGEWERPFDQPDSFEERIKNHAHQDEKLHAIARSLDDLQKRHSNRLKAVVRHIGRYCHAYSTTIEVFDTESGDNVIGEDADKVADTLCDFMNWIYRMLEAEYNYMMSDEQVDETIRANDYDFFENGSRATV